MSNKIDHVFIIKDSIQIYLMSDLSEALTMIVTIICWLLK
jgi:hypothetical protein